MRITLSIILLGLVSMLLTGIVRAATPDDVTVTITGTGTISWVAPTENVDGSPLTDLAGYKVYIGRSSDNYTVEVPIGIADPTSGQITIPIADENDINWFMAMTALDADGNESALSNEVIKTLTVTFVDSRVPKSPTSFDAVLDFQCSTDNILVTCEITVQ